MAETKYGKYFVECTRPKGEATGHHVGDYGSGVFNIETVMQAFPEANADGSGLYYTEPHVMVRNTHVHDFDEYLLFLGTNFADINDFEGEVEIAMGEEGEIYLITSPTILFVPAGLVHCPLNFKKITKPIFFFHFRVYDKEKK